jgi:DNA-binding NtrC family response regulator
MSATILVADDDAPIVEIVAAVLEDEGHTVLRAYDGAEALMHLDRDGLDLLVTDNMMPRLSGVELIAHLHAHPRLAVPVILMSAVTPVRMPPTVTFLPKPFDLDRLTSLVDHLLA